MVTPTLKTIPVDGLDLAVWEWAGDGPPLLFAHATGFHGRCWDQIARRFPGRRCLAVDFRGHGRSSKPDPPYHWGPFGRDLAGTAEQLGVEGAIGIGHSMGGHSVVAAALLRPETFSALLLVDPTIFPRHYYRCPPLDASFVLRRRNYWTSPEEMFERFRNRGPFARWRPEVLRDYCTYGLLPSGSEFVLACPPAVEASIYGHSNTPESDLYDGIPSILNPVVVMRAGTAILTTEVFDPAASPAAPDLATIFPQGRDVLLEDQDHFIPMEAPDVVAEEILKLV
ncbi:MAG TPA: alpha/beta hydrolase [Bryobacteraceae bacterium]